MYQIAAQWPAKAMAQIFITGNTEIDALHYTVRNDFYHPEIEWAKGSRLIAVTAQEGRIWENPCVICSGLYAGSWRNLQM